MEEKTMKRPLLKAIIFTIIPLICATIAGAIIAINSFEGNYSIVVQSALFALSIIIGIMIIKFLHLKFEEIGFKKIINGTAKNMLYFIPLIVIELLPFFTGFNEQNSPSRIILLIIFTIIVGINEELYFRGIILNLFKNNGVKAIIISSILFGLGHIINAIVNTNYLYIVLQIIFSFIVGIICAEIVIITKSIIPVIIFHTIHDFVASITNDSVSGIALIILIIQMLILILYIVLTWNKLKRHGGSGGEDSGTADETARRSGFL
jgi:membrane protease YdiL (CAAX protease family)